jgi:hypothetical protein
VQFQIDKHFFAGIDQRWRIGEPAGEGELIADFVKTASPSRATRARAASTEETSSATIRRWRGFIGIMRSLDLA